MTSNNLDVAWAGMSAADRIVFLGHDRDHLDHDDRARLVALLSNAAKQRQSTTRRPATGTHSRRAARNRSRRTKR